MQARRTVLAGLAGAPLTGMIPTPALAKPPPAGPANGTVLIVRHAEKPASGPGLSPAGDARARAYATYLAALPVDGTTLRPDLLFATRDSRESHRPRLTLTPLAAALGKPLDLAYADGQVRQLARMVTREGAGRVSLIAWHHGHIPALMREFGADPSAFLPGGRWPGGMFDRVILLRFDTAGQVQPDRSRAITEPAFPA